MVLVIDNYDSFTYNLVQYLGELGADIEVVRNDALTVEEIERKAPEKIVLSPGPCTPKEAGVSVPLIQRLQGTVAILGVCLGHQSMGEALGGKVVRAPKVMHGKVSGIHHEDKGIFAGVQSPFMATRYHSLIVERESLPPELEITAWADGDRETGVIMGLQHKTLPPHKSLYGVQFHPESIMTAEGKTLLKNFLAL